MCIQLNFDMGIKLSRFKIDLTRKYFKKGCQLFKTLYAIKWQNGISNRTNLKKFWVKDNLRRVVTFKKKVKQIDKKTFVANIEQTKGI